MWPHHLCFFCMASVIVVCARIIPCISELVLFPFTYSGLPSPKIYFSIKQPFNSISSLQKNLQRARPQVRIGERMPLIYEWWEENYYFPRTNRHSNLSFGHLVRQMLGQENPDQKQPGLARWRLVAWTSFPSYRKTYSPKRPNSIPRNNNINGLLIIVNFI